MSKSKWDSGNIPDQTGRVAVVTGASSGIGWETARALAEKNAEVILAVRNSAKGTTAEKNIRDRHPHARVEVMDLDLADLKSVRRFAAAFNKHYDRLDLLINNAGVMVPPYSQTADGFELQFGTNHLGHFALTGLLMDLITATPGSRIVNVSSAAHHFGNLDLDDLEWEKRPYRKSRAYGDSKIANLYFTYELQGRLEKNGGYPLVTAAHPGWTATDLQRHTRLAAFLNHFVAQDISMGALPTLYAAVADEVVSGGFYGPSGWREMRGYPKKVVSNGRSHDKETARRLWEISEEKTGVKFDLDK